MQASSPSLESGCARPLLIIEIEIGSSTFQLEMIINISIKDNHQYLKYGNHHFHHLSPAVLARS